MNRYDRWFGGPEISIEKAQRPGQKITKTMARMRKEELNSRMEDDERRKTKTKKKRKKKSGK